MSKVYAVHISDIHFGKAFGYEDKNALCRAIKKAVDSAKSATNERPTFLLCTGDLANKFTKIEMKQARGFLPELAQSLQIEPGNVIVCPGNHDVDYEETMSYEAEFGPDSQKWGTKHFDAYLEVADDTYRNVSTNVLVRRPPSPREAIDPFDIFSVHYYEHCDLLIYSVSSVTVESHRRDDRWGFVGKAQLDRVDDCVIKYFAGRPHLIDRARRIVLVHHPLFAPYDRNPSALRDVYFLNWLRQAEIDLVIHGHQHYTRSNAIDDGERRFLCVGVGSIGTARDERPDEPISLNIIGIESEGLGPRKITVDPREFHRMSNEWTYHSMARRQFWIEVPNFRRIEAARRVGLAGTLAAYEKKQKQIAEGKQVKIDGSEAALDCYLEAIREAIRQTGASLRATSFLHSQFWADRLSEEVIELNKQLKNRASYAQRIFLTNQPIEPYVAGTVQRAFARKEAGDPDAWNRIGQINRNLLALSEFGFDMKIVDANRYDSIIDQFDPSRHELAIYNFESGDVGRWRIDIFELSPEGQVLGVTVRVGLAADQPTIQQYLAAFDRAWKDPSSRDVPTYVARVQREMARVEKDIQYDKNWLTKFRELEANNDPTLSEEAQCAMTVLQSRLRAMGKNRFDKYLDVGVCTGRYPKLLKNRKLISQCVTTDIDRDVQIEMKHHHPKITFKLGDIREPEMIERLGANFDLITCMLGTACHFGLDRRAEPWHGRSGLESAIRNMMTILKPGGLILLSVWQKEGNNRLLEDIYTEAEKKRLLDGSPDEIDIMDAAKTTGMRFSVEKVGQTRRLTLYALYRDPPVMKALSA